MTTTAPQPPLPGFELASSEVKRRMIMSIEGAPGTGKTDLALTAPGPIAFFKFDLNSDFTIAKFAAGKRIYKTEIAIPKPESKDSQSQAQQVWLKFQADYHRALAATQIRTVIWDTATEVWELCRLAAFGKLSQVSQYLYIEVNNSFRQLIKSAFDSNTNLIMVHRLKPEWENYTDSQGRDKSKKTGRMERAGFSDLGFACQVMVQTYFTPDGTLLENGEEPQSPFQLKVLKCTQNPRITGKVYSDVGGLRMNSFPILASEVFPGTDFEKDWS